MVRFIFAQFPAAEYQTEALNDEDAPDRLISYAYLKELDETFLNELNKNGVHPKKKGKS